MRILAIIGLFIGVMAVLGFVGISLIETEIHQITVEKDITDKMNME